MGVSSTTARLALALLLTPIAFVCNANEPPSLQEAISAHGLAWHPMAMPKAKAAGERPSFGLGGSPDPMPNQQEVITSGGVVNFLGGSALSPSLKMNPLLDLSHLSGPPRNQGSCGTCVVFAVMGALEAEWKRLTGTPANYSEQEVVSCSGIYSSCGRGSFVPTVASYFSATGRLNESGWPYESGSTGRVPACRFPSNALRQLSTKVAEWGYFKITRAEDLRQALYSFQSPLALDGMGVYTDFYSYGGGVYRPLPVGTSFVDAWGNRVTQALEGYHAVLVVGYSDQDQSFLVRNSWGTGWGDGGYFKIAYAEVNAGALTTFGVKGVAGVARVGAPAGPTVTNCRSLNSSTAYCDIVAPHDKEYVDFDVKAEALATGNGTNSGTMQLNMSIGGQACNFQYGVTYPVDNATELKGNGFNCTKRLFGGESARVSISAPNSRADAVHTIGSVTFTEAPPGPVQLSAVCASANPGAAYCDLTVPKTLQYANFVINGEAYATSNGTNSGSMQLNMSIDGVPCNSGYGVNVGIDNATRLSGAAYTCRPQVAGGKAVRVLLAAPNSRADAGYTRATATFVAGPAVPASTVAFPAVLSSDALAFGGASIGTSSAPQTVTLTNLNETALAISAVSAAGPFSQTNNCGTSLAPLSGCEIAVSFRPGAPGAATGTLSVTTAAGLSPPAIGLSGSGEQSLVKHYYRAILNRAPEAGGQEFWEAERARLQALGANVNEIWFVMANYFFNSAEYTSLGKTNDQFLTDVYNTFFNRPPDGGGLAFWQSQMAAGLSREGVIFWFMFSNEFRTFTQGIFGNTAARPEVDMVMDLFRGLLNRFPDTAALNAFVATLRNAQCQTPAARAGAVYQAVNDMSYFFMFGSSEYPARNRTNTQFVSDMYNAFLRRGGTDEEVDFWIHQLDTGASDRNRMRAAFIASPEFGARVNAVIAATCVR